MIVNDKYKYSDITAKIIACAFKVHNSLGNGFQEKIYQRALDIELKKASLKVNREYQMFIYYEDLMIGTRFADFFIEDKIIVEIKACSKLENAHIAQALNYLETTKEEIALLINFVSKSLEYKRLINNKL